MRQAVRYKIIHNRHVCFFSTKLDIVGKILNNLCNKDKTTSEFLAWRIAKAATIG